ncbi:MAG TPA: polynucleotide adenylyltransferase PcnB [Rhabdochlamydiaceae bacterium]|nr:polynucleotide adenylyltransferase PcnB [Rhabdochlamydiaceae bacterium]
MEQKIYPFEVHQLPIEQVDTHALYVMEKLKDAGFVAYLVGGSVRDLLLNKKPKDYDISTSASPEEIRALFRNCILVGRRFRLAHIRFGRKVLEVSTFRTGDTESEQLIVRDNVWGNPEQDAERRDFTINALFYDPADQTIIDYVGGYEDLKRKYLRTIGHAYSRFKQDPVRMLRMLKFQARFGFEVDPNAHIALLECRHDIVKSSAARILEEVLRMLESGASQSFFKLMTNHGILDYLLPNLASFLEKEEGNEIFSFLQEVDLIFQDPTSRPLERPILMSCLVFPILKEHIERYSLEHNRPPHLGEIHMQTRDLLNEIFHGFFSIPRKLRISMTSILILQYRLTPIEKKYLRKKRIPSDPEFPLALDFLNLRCCLEPGLQKIYEEWVTIAEHPEKHKAVPRRRRRRK